MFAIISVACAITIHGDKKWSGAVMQAYLKVPLLDLI